MSIERTNSIMIFQFLTKTHLLKIQFEGKCNDRTFCEVLQQHQDCKTKMDQEVFGGHDGPLHGSVMVMCA